MKKVVFYLVIIFIPLFFIGCKGGGYINIGDDDFPINLEYLAYSGINGDIDDDLQNRQIIIIRDEDEYERLYKQYNPYEDIPYVDFMRYEVIAIISDVKRTGGYDIKIRSIKEYQNYILLDIVYQEPGSSCLVTEALTQPFVFVKIKRSYKSIKIKEEKQIYSCF